MTIPQNFLYVIPDQRTYKVYKHSDSTVDYKVSWKEYLESSESIASQTVTASNVTVDSNSSSGQVSTFFVSAGEPNTSAHIDLSITTDNATPRTFKIRVYFYFEYPATYYDNDYYY